MKIALIVEGFADQEAFPTIVAKLGNLTQVQVFAPNPIRAGTFPKLERPGIFEKFVELAASRDAEAIVVAVDLDDGCPVQARDSIEARRLALEQRFGKPVHVCLIKREFETWFLQLADELKIDASDYGWKDDFGPAEPTAVRGAKELLGRSCTKGYKEIVDQPILAKKINLKTLYARDRSFRKFVKSILGIEYGQINALLA